MGLRYDWEIEAEKTRVQRTGEGSEYVQRRRTAQLRFLIFILLVLAIFASIVGFVILRLQAVEQEIEQALRGTVEAEVTALRLGDFSSYSAIQRSAAPDWLQIQQQIFNQYQDLKTHQNVQLSGEISAIEVDRTRARVNVQEIVNGVPYTRVWFYWHYEDGWRHVPPDYTFWGDLEVQKQQNVTVRYKMVDKDFGTALMGKVASWLQTTCETLVCSTVPDLTVEVIPDETLQVSWVQGDQWWMQVPSPYVRRALSDMPFDLEGQMVVAERLADRLVNQSLNNLQPVYPSDAVYLKQALTSWLVGQMVQVNTDSYLVTSLTANFGVQTISQLLRGLQPNSTIGLLGTITQKSLEQTALDWRDYLTWRLNVEDDLRQKRDEANFLALYDTRDAVVRDVAYTRFSAADTPVKKTVTSAQISIGNDASVNLSAVVEVGEGDTRQQSDALFRLVEGVWKRVN